MKTLFGLFLIFILITFTACKETNIQKPDIKNKDGDKTNIGDTMKKTNFNDYKSSWEEVQKHLNKGLPKSALEVVNKIYSQAKEEKNYNQIVKSLIHKMIYIQQVEEETFVKVQKELNDELKTAEFPLKPILHSMIAEQYWNYYQNNRWKFLNRSATTQFNNDDMRTWDLTKVVEEVFNHYKLSIDDIEKLKTTNLDIYDGILTKGSNTSHLRPTLYDFLAHRAIDFFMNHEAGLTKPANQFTLNNEEFLLSGEKFVDLKIETEEKLSFHYTALIMLQKLTKFHIEDKNVEALIDIELKRLKFVYDKAIISNKEIIFENILKSMIEIYKDSKGAVDIYYEYANLYYELGNTFSESNSIYKWHLKKAKEICQTAIEKYKDTNGVNNCKYLIQNIELKNLTFTTEKIIPKDKPFLALVNYKNIDKLYIKVVETNRDELKEKRNLYYEDFVKFYAEKKALKKWDVVIPNDGDFQNHSTEVKLEPLNFGVYVVLMSNNENFDKSKGGIAYSTVNVSNISFIQKNTTTDGLMEVYVLDRESGHPLKGVKVQSWYEDWSTFRQRYVESKGKKYESDKDGYFSVSHKDKNANYFRMEFTNGKDTLFTDDSFYVYSPYRDNYKPPQTFYFLDRMIYRPGQTVYFKGIMITPENGNIESKILPNYSNTITLYDVNYQKVSDVQIKTNEYGTFSGTFVIPTNLLNGQMHLQDSYGSVYFSVEEYKRPKFEVKFNDLTKEYKLNEEVSVKGTAKALAGYNIDNADVKYRVVRQAYFPYSWYYWWYTPPTSSMEILNGFTKTDSNGEFEVKFKSIPDLTLDKATKPAFRYTIYADVTDLNGETRSSVKTVTIGYTSLILNLYLGGTINKDNNSLKYSINSTNLSGEFLKATGNLLIYKLKEPKSALKSRLWARPDNYVMKKEEFNKEFPENVYDKEDSYYSWEKGEIVYEETFDTEKNKNLEIKTLDKFETGVYIAEMISKDSEGNEIKDIKYLTVFSTVEKQLPYPMFDWYSAVKNTVEPGDKAVYLIGSSYENVNVIYEIEHKGQIVEKQFLKLNNEQKKIEIPVLEKHRGNLSVHFTFIKNNRAYQHSDTIVVPWTNKEIDISFETFRNKLQPGEKEEWRIKIKGKNGEKIAAEMVATLYDASLDVFRANYYYLSVYPYNTAQHYWNNYYSFGIINSQIGGILNAYNQYYYYNKIYDTFNWFGFYWYDYNSHSYGGHEGGKVYRKKSAAKFDKMAEEVDDAPMMEMSKSVADEKVTAKPQTVVASTDSKSISQSGLDTSKQEATGKKQPEEKKEDLSAVKARSNFNETAFFYPHLLTDPDGSVVISFTIPEALTKWKMLGLAHTKDLKYGVISNELVTQKDLMVVPNAPRFLRENDKIVFTSKITNLTENEMKGAIELMLFDAATMNPVDDKFKNTKKQQTFTAAKGQSGLVEWELEVPEGIDAVTYKVVAKSGNFSDGEEMTLPVLRNRMLVTETMPLPIRALQTKEYKFEKLLKSKDSTTLRNHKLTLEFTSNPVWYAVQALPYIIEYPYECTEQMFSRYYANSIASYIVNSNPKIKKIFDLWQNLPNSNALLSNLEKNQELKSLMLQETPWVAEANNETERKKRIALLFDFNRMANEKGKIIKKLSEEQMPSGGWSWFKGMYESRYITTHLVTGFAHLHAIKVLDVRKDTTVWNMIQKAIPYLDREIQKDYDDLIKYKVDMDKNNLGYYQIQYLYARSYFLDIDVNSSVKTAFDYYKKQSQKYWLDFNNYAKGMIALALFRYDEVKTAKEITASLKEHSLNSEEMGMYWKESYGYYWYQLPIETHALMIEVFSEITKDEKVIDDLKTWLIKSKQTQDWKTTKATADACFALLLQGDDWLKEDKLAEITMGGQKVDPYKHDTPTEAGTGYFKVSWNGSEIKPEMGNITVKNNNKVVAWGGVYWQYFEQLDKITAAETPLKLSKKLFVERDSSTGPVITPIEKESVKIGDKIKVRIELRVDRDMEYVHMKDMRSSSFEPLNVISQYKWQDGLGYYETTKDASTNFFFDYLRKGTYVFEYSLRVTHEGDFSNGITTIQSMYAPEFSSHSEGVRVKTGKK